jgi:predicted kinase
MFFLVFRARGSQILQSSADEALKKLEKALSPRVCEGFFTIFSAAKADAEPSQGSLKSR